MQNTQGAIYTYWVVVLEDEGGGRGRLQSCRSCFPILCCLEFGLANLSYAYYFNLSLSSPLKK